MSVSSPSNQFYSSMLSGDSSMVFVANKFPNKGIQSFNIEESSGKFEIIYDREYEGTPSHSTDKGLDKSMKGTTVKVSQKVTGMIDPENKTVAVDSGCVVASTKKSVFTVNISLTKIKATSDKTMEVTGKWGVLPEKSATLTHEAVQFTNIEWKA